MFPFPVGFACLGLLFLGIGREGDKSSQLVVLLRRDSLIIPVITGGELRRLRAEGKTAPLFCKGIIPCWKDSCSWPRRGYVCVLVC